MLKKGNLSKCIATLIIMAHAGYFFKILMKFER